MILNKKALVNWIDSLPDSTELVAFDNGMQAIVIPNDSVGAAFPSDDDDRCQSPVSRIIAYGKEVGDQINWLWNHKNFKPKA